MNSIELQVSWIGKTAYELLFHNPAARIMGVTSRGLFLHLTGDRIVFISGEQYRGPLTLNVKEEPGSLGFCCSADNVTVSAGKIILNPGSHVIDFQYAAAWESPEVSSEDLAVEQRLAFLSEVADQVLSIGSETGLSDLLVGLLQESELTRVEKDPPVPLMALLKLQRALETGNVQAALAAAEPFLGMGSGLTPSGDDLLLGFLLALNRWGRRLAVHFDIQSFNDRVLALACRRTTTLSSSLLSCAAHGQADERLVIALDALFTGRLSSPECVALLRKWGSSSGCDAFVGMALAVLFFSTSIARHPYAH